MLEVLLVLGAAALLGSGTFIGYRLGCKKSALVSISSPLLSLPPPEEIAALPEAGEGPYRRRGDCTAIVPATDELWLQQFNRRILSEIDEIQHIETEQIKRYREQQMEKLDITYLIDVLFGWTAGDYWLAKEIIKTRKDVGDREALLSALTRPRLVTEEIHANCLNSLRPFDRAISDIIFCASTRGFFDITFVQTVAGIKPHDFSWSNYMDEAVKHFPDAYRWSGLNYI